MNFLKITPIESVKRVGKMAERELWWQANVGVFETGGNNRKDIQKVLKQRIQYKLG